MSCYSRTTLRELKKRYLNILKKCFLANLMVFSVSLPFSSLARADGIDLAKESFTHNNLGTVIRHEGNAIFDMKNSATLVNGVYTYDVTAEDEDALNPIPGLVGVVAKSTKVIKGATDNANESVIQANGYNLFAMDEKSGELVAQNVTINGAAGVAYLLEGAKATFDNIIVQNTRQRAFANEGGSLTFNGDTVLKNNEFSDTSSGMFGSGHILANVITKSADAEGKLSWKGETLFNGKTSITNNKVTNADYVTGGFVYNEGNIKFNEKFLFSDNSAEGYVNDAFIANNGYVLYDENDNTVLDSNNNPILSGNMVFEKDAIFDNNQSVSEYGYGILVNSSGSITFNGNTVFKNNSVAGTLEGCAIVSNYGNYAYNPDGTFVQDSQGNFPTKGFMTFNGTASFIENVVSGGEQAEGGALSNDGSLKFLGEALFKNNTLNQLTSNQWGARGGALVNYGYYEYDSNSNLFISGDLTFEKEAFFEGNQINASGNAYGGAIYNDDGSLTFKDKASFEGNKALSDDDWASGGAISNYGTYTYDSNGDLITFGSIVFEKEVAFKENIADTRSGNASGGAIENDDGSLTFKDKASFEGNKVLSGGYRASGGAISNYGTHTYTANGDVITFGDIVFEKEVAFKENIADGNGESYGGALNNHLGSVTFKDKASFEGNKALSEAYASGGAILNYGDYEYTSNGDVITFGSIVFEKEVVFKENIADGFNESYGGAIVNDWASLTFKDKASFEGNKALSEEYAEGGAIYNYGSYTYDSNGYLITFGDIVFEKEVAFKENIADTRSGNASGGAIYNELGSVTFKDKASFEGNKVSSYGDAYGGAISNSGASEIDPNGNMFILGDLVFEKESVFKGNQVISYGQDSIAAGGALTNLVINTTFNGQALFENNKATGVKVLGGAVANSSMNFMDPSLPPMIDANGNVVYAKTSFKDNVIFKNNKTEGIEYSIGGALGNLMGTIDFEKTALFEGNTSDSELSAMGGAIITAGELNFKGNAEFINNKTNSKMASSGGAIYMMPNADGSSTETILGGNFTFAANKTILNGVETPNDIALDAYSDVAGTDGYVDLILNGDKNTIGSFEGGFSGNASMNNPDIKPYIVKLGEGTVILGDKSVNENYFGSYVQINGTMIASSDTFFNNSSENLILGGELKTHGAEINHKAIIGSDFDLDGNIVVGSATHYTNLEEMEVNDSTIGGVQFAEEDLGATIGFGSYTKAEKEAEIALLKGKVISYVDDKNTADTSDDEVVSYLASDKLFTTETLPEGKLTTFKVTGALNNEYGNTIAFKNANVELDSMLAEQGTGATYEFSGSTLQMPEELIVSNKVVAENMSLGGEATNVLFADIEVKDGSSLDIGNKQVMANTISFGEESTLKLSLHDLSDFGSLTHATVNGDEKANLEIKLTKGLDQEQAVYQIFNEDNDLKLKENKLVEIIDQNDGSYLIGKKETSELEKDLGLTQKEASVLSALLDGNAKDNEEFSKVQEELLTTLQLDTPAATRHARGGLKALSGKDTKIYQSLTTSQFSQMQAVISQMLMNTTAPIFGHAGGEDPARATVYVKGLYDKVNSLAGDGFRMRSKGAVLGVQSALTEDLTVGVGYAGINTIVKEDWHRTEVDSNTGFISAHYQPNNWWVSVLATYSRGQYDEEKQVLSSTGKANYDVDSLGAQITTGYNIKKGKIILTPEVGIRYLNAKQEGYQDSLGTTVQGINSDFVTAMAGFKVGADLGWVRPLAGVMVGYDIITDDISSVNTLANGSTYTINGEALDRLSTTVSAGVAADISENASLRFEYGGSYRKEYIEHSGMLRFEYKF